MNEWKEGIEGEEKEEAPTTQKNKLSTDRIKITTYGNWKGP